jgi:hypothetical protein
MSKQSERCLKSIQKLKKNQRRIFLDNYYRQRCLVYNLMRIVILRLSIY